MYSEDRYIIENERLFKDRLIEELNKLKKLEKSFQVDTNYRLKELFDSLSKHISNRRVLLLIAPQITYPLPSEIRKSIEESGVRIPFTISYRLERMFIEALIRIIKKIKELEPCSLKTYLLAINWRGTLEDLKEVYRRSVQGLEVISTPNELSKLLGSEFFDYVIILVLQDYGKREFINVLNMVDSFIKKNNKRGVLIVLPEIAYVPQSGSRLVTAVTYIRKEVLSRLLSRALIYEMPLQGED